MNRFFFIIFLFIQIGIQAQSDNFIQLSSSEFSKLISEKDIVLLDVRTASEFGNGHIDESGNLNFYSLSFNKNLQLLPRDKKILLYCNTGYRSEIAAKRLIKYGYKNVYNLEYGIMKWELENYPTIIDKNAKPETKNKYSIEEFEKLIQSNDLLFIDFYATWCGPCREMMPLIDSLKTEYHNLINIEKVNVGASKKLTRNLKIKSVPYFVLYKNGKIVFSKEGILTRKEIITLFDKYQQ